MSQGATHTWTGNGTTGVWSDPSNWQGNNSPQSGESGAELVFPPGALRLNSSNDLTGLSITQMALIGTNYVLNGSIALTLSSSQSDSIAASGGSNRIAMPLILETTNSFRVATNASLGLAGQLEGPGGLTLIGGGLLALAPSAGVDNAYLGTTRVLDGTLQLESGFRVEPVSGNRFYASAVPAALVVGDTNSLTPAILTGMGLSTNTALILVGSGRYLVNGDLLSFASLAGDGLIDCQGQSFIVGGDNSSTTFSGWIDASSDAGLQKVGTGSLALSGRDIGPVHLGVNEGSLIVDGNFSNSTAVVSLGMNGLTEGRLEGNGILGGVFGYGSLSPGHGSSGKLTCGHCDLSVHSRLLIGMAGTRAGIDYDQLVVTESVSFETTDPVLDISMAPGFVGAVGNQYTIIRNDGTSPVVLPTPPPANIGFTGLGEGTVFTLSNGAAFRISYQGGDGNDVVLTQVAARPILNSPSPLANGSVLLSGAGSPTVAYEVQSTTNLADQSGWLVRGTVLAQADGSLGVVLTNIPSLSQVYYRLRAP